MFDESARVESRKRDNKRGETKRKMTYHTDMWSRYGFHADSVAT